MCGIHYSKFKGHVAASALKSHREKCSPLYKLTTETCIHTYILRKPSVWSVGPLATVGSGPHCVLLNKSTGGKDWLVSHSVKLSHSQICRSQHAREVLGIKYSLEYVGMNYDRSLNCPCDL